MVDGDDGTNVQRECEKANWVENELVDSASYNPEERQRKLSDGEGTGERQTSRKISRPIDQSVVSATGGRINMILGREKWVQHSSASLRTQRDRFKRVVIQDEPESKACGAMTARGEERGDGEHADEKERSGERQLINAWSVTSAEGCSTCRSTHTRCATNVLLPLLLRYALNGEASTNCSTLYCAGDNGRGRCGAGLILPVALWADGQRWAFVWLQVWHTGWTIQATP